MKKGSLLLDKNLYLICSVTLLGLMSVASIAPAFPKIMSELDLSKNQIGLLVTCFSLPSALLAPFLGIMADRMGRKIILVPCLFMFGICGFTCGLIDNYTVILILRIFQGIGGSAFATVTVTLIADIYRGPKVAEIMGINATVISVSVAIYPVLGGALATLDWHYPFLLAGLAVPVGFAVLFLLDNPEPDVSQNIGEYLSGTWKCLKDIRLIGYYFMGIVAFIILYGAFITYYPLLMAERYNTSPFVIGIVNSGGSMAMAISSSQTGRLTRWFSAGTLMKIAFGFNVIGSLMVPFMPSLILLIVPSILINLAMGIIMPCLHTTISQKAPMEYRAAVMSINATSIRLGQTMGPPVMTLAYVFGGYTGAYLTATLLALLVVVIAVASGKMMTSGNKLDKEQK
jgi:ACDE family multidrug resistance protein